jgi:N utilization substance protein A
LDEETNRVTVVVPDDQLSLAIGRRGQNVRLASELTGLGIDIMSETQSSERRMSEMAQMCDLFVKALDVDEMIARLLVSEGFERIEEVAFVDVVELASIEGFELEVAQELQDRAQRYLLEEQRAYEEKLASLKVTDDLKHFDGITPQILVALAEHGVRSLDDLADLAGDELREMVPGLSFSQANALIMRAREHWFPQEDEPRTDA